MKKIMGVGSRAVQCTVTIMNDGLIYAQSC